MASSEDFRHYSANCSAFADRVTDPGDKAHLIEMAQAFLELNEAPTTLFAVNRQAWTFVSVIAEQDPLLA